MGSTPPNPTSDQRPLSKRESALLPCVFLAGSLGTDGCECWKLVKKSDLLGGPGVRAGQRPAPCYHPRAACSYLFHLGKSF